MCAMWHTKTQRRDGNIMEKLHFRLEITRFPVLHKVYILSGCKWKTVAVHFWRESLKVKTDINRRGAAKCEKVFSAYFLNEL